MSSPSFQRRRSLISGGYETSTVNFWGNGSNGDYSSSGSASLGSGNQDSAVLVKHYTTLTINVSDIITMAGRNQSVVIYVDGDCTINGTLDGSKGASSAGVAISLIRYGPLGEDFTNNTTEPGYFITTSVPVAGGAGGAARSTDGTGNTGTAGSNGGLGGGGSGARDTLGTSGAGNTATSYSSGTGGGAAANLGSATDGATNGGAGGAGAAASLYGAGGGSGNPGGAGSQGGSSGTTGTAGTILLFVKGVFTIGASGLIKSNGSNGGAATGTTAACGGGASGGGRVIDIYAGTLSNSGTSGQVNGGTGGVASGAATNRNGGIGGAGSSTLQQVMK